MIVQQVAGAFLELPRPQENRPRAASQIAILESSLDYVSMGRVVYDGNHPRHYHQGIEHRTVYG
jgi:hypothetical protein